MNDENKPTEPAHIAPLTPADPPHHAEAPKAAPVLTPDPEPYMEPSKKKSVLHEIFSTLGILVTALIVALLIITFVFRSYQVDGPSMETALQNGDKLIIWKVPRTWANITKHHYIPNRGDEIGRAHV